MKWEKIICFILSLIYSVFICLGYSFHRFNSLALFEKWYFIFIFLFMIAAIFYILYYIFSKIPLKRNNIKNERLSKIISFFKKNPFLISLLIILICWIPYIIAFYPGILSPDPNHQILQFFNIDNKYSYYSILIDENVIITNHHPVLHTLLLGGCVKIGMIFGSFNLGLFIYSIIQILFLSSTLAYIVKFLFKHNMGKIYFLICLLIFSLVPVFPFYAMSSVKDVIFTCLFIWYIIFIFNYVKMGKVTFWIVLVLILIMLFRNNGFHIVILSLPFLLFVKGRRKFILFLVLFTFSFYYSYNHYILPHFHVTQGSVREVLSIPFQQTARYVKYYGKEVSKEEKKVIDKILDYDSLAVSYDPQKSDPVKNEYNRFASNVDLKKYFKVWLYELKKHPNVYLSATINNTYGYYYPTHNWYIYNTFNSFLRDYNFDYHYNNQYGLRAILIIWGGIFPYIPIAGLIVNIGFSSWVLLFMVGYLLYRRKYRDICIFIPMIIVFFVCLASPVNTYFRYAMPNIFVMPLVFGIFRKSVSE